MRISKYSKCSNVGCVMAYSYIQRLAKVGSYDICVLLDCCPAWDFPP